MTTDTTQSPAAPGAAPSRVAWLPTASADAPHHTAGGRVAQPLTRGQRGAVWLIGGLTGALGLIGLANSFAEVRSAVAPMFGALAWTVPVAIDLGVAVFAALDLLMTLLGMPVRWLRPINWALVTTMIVLNVSAQDTLIGALPHAVLPALWVVAVEVGMYAVRRRLGLAGGQQMDGVRGSRWLLAPISTAALRRRMILWEEPSYAAALARERRRRRVLADLRAKYGRISWRWKAPVDKRIAYRFDELAPATPATPVPATGTATPATARAATPASERPHQPAMAVSDRSNGRTGGRSNSGSSDRSNPGGRQVTAADIAALRAAEPDLTQQQIADQLGIGIRTLRRRLAATDAPADTAAAEEAGA